MKFKYIYIVFLLLLNSTFSFAQEIDSLTVEKNEPIVLRRLPDNYKHHYSGRDFVYEYTLEAETVSWWQRFKNWLEQFLSNSFDTPTAGVSRFINRIIKGIYILIALIVIYFIVKTLVNKEGNWIFGRSSDKLTINTTELEKKLLETDFDKLITKAVKEQNYRLAVRYQYLKVLKELTNKEIIIWEFEKTNQDYYYEIKNTQLKESFAYVSYIYNYSWYGGFDITTHDYSEAEIAFDKLITTLK